MCGEGAFKKANAKTNAAQEILVERLAEIIAKTEANSQELSELDSTKNIVSYNPDKPFILDEIRKDTDFQKLQQKEIKNLDDKIDVRQMQIFEKKK